MRFSFVLGEVELKSVPKFYLCKLEPYLSFIVA